MKTIFYEENIYFTKYMTLENSLTANDRCLSFKYIFPTNDLTASWPSAVYVYTEGDGLNRIKVAELTTESATDVWQTKEVQINSVNNLKVSEEALFLLLTYVYKTEEN